MESERIATPRPDPTTLTSALVERAIAAAREVITARLDGMERAAQVGRELTDRWNEKQEAALTKQIDQDRAAFALMGNARDDKISDLKDRIVVIEGRRTGANESAALIIALVSMGISALGMLVMFLELFHH